MAGLVAASLIARIAADDANFHQAMERAHAKVQEGEGRFSHLKGTIGGVFAGAALIAGAGMAVGAFLDVLHAGQAANEGIDQTKAVIKSTGGQAGVSAQMVGDLADHFMGLTGIQDDTVRSAENMLLTFTNIGKDVFPLATQTTLDMSQALGQDAKSSAIQLGKALNDPIQGISALQRVGVTFDAEQKQLIKTYIDHGDKAKAQAVILKELQKEFGGSAAAAGHANGGIKILEAQFDNAKQSVGQLILSALVPLATAALPNVLAAVQGVGNIVHTVSDLWAHHREVLIPIIGVIGGLLVAALVAGAVAAWGMAAGVIAATWPFLAIGLAIGGVIVLLKAAYDHIGIVHNAVDGIRAALPYAAAAFSVIAGRVGDFLGVLGRLIGIIGNILGMLGRLRDAFNSIHIPNLGDIHIPGFAEGGMTPGGPVLVGERGPEVLIPPAGTRVMTLDNARSVGSGAGGAGGVQPIVLQLDGWTLARATLPYQHAAIRNATGLRGN